MGIQHAASLLYVMKSLSIKSVKDMIRTKVAHQHDYNANQQTTTQQSQHQPHHHQKYYIDVDCNWVACYLGATKNPTEAAHITSDLLQALAARGFIVTPVCDGEIRHHSKRASIDRVVTNEKLKIRSLVDRYKLLSMTQQKQYSSNSNLDGNEKDLFEKELTALNKSVTSLERKNKRNHRLPSSFAKDLKEELEMRGAHDENDNYGKVEKVRVGFFQADALIAKRAVEKKSHLIVSRDSDFFLLVGQQCLTIRSFTLKKGRGRQSKNIEMMKLTDIEIAVSNSKMKDMLLESLDSKARDSVKVSDAKYPLFAEDNLFLRASIGVILGSDVCVGGIKKIGPKKLSDKIAFFREKADNENRGGDCANNTFIIQQLQKWACSNDEMTECVFKTFVMALVYEPANEVNITDGAVIFETCDPTSHIKTILISMGRCQQHCLDI
jgi:hypothetical protein